MKPRRSISTAISNAWARFPGTAARETAGIGMGSDLPFAGSRPARRPATIVGQHGVWHLARVRTRVVVVSALLTSLLVACGSSGDDSSGAASTATSSAAVTSADVATSTTEVELTAPTTQVTTTTSADAVNPAVAYSEPGPFPVGVAELTGGPVPITVFYPGLDGAEAGKQEASYDLRAWLPSAEAAKVRQAQAVQMRAYSGLTPADPDGGPYPLVLFSHGLAGYRLQSTFLMTHLASWGFVVAAVEHPYRNLTAAFGDLGSLVAGFGSTDAPDVEQLVAAIDQVEVAASQPTGPLAGLTVETTDVGAVGHSAGGFAVYGAAAVDPRIVTYVALGVADRRNVQRRDADDRASGPAT